MDSARDARNFLKANEKILGSSTIVAALSEGCIAPFLHGLSVHEVAEFIKLRERYEKDVVAYANLNSRNVNKVRTSWKHKVDLPLMEEWADLKFEQPWSEITEEMFKEELYKIRDRTVYSRTDVADVLKGKIKMDLKIEDPEQRVLKYFADIRQIITDNGLKDLLKPDAEKNAKYCSIVIKNLAPRPLKEDIEEHLTYDEYKEHKKDRKKLYALIVERAVKQQKRHNYAVKYAKDSKTYANGEKRKRSENDTADVSNHNPKRNKKGKGKVEDYGKKDYKKYETGPAACDNPDELAKLKVHTVGCLMCGGDHKIGEHSPKLTKAQNNYLWDAYYKAKGITNPYKSQRKFLRKLFGQVVEEDEYSDHDPKFTVKINGLLELPAIVDTGARSLPAIARKWLDKLLELDPCVEVESLKKPIIFQAAGGHELTASQVIKVKIDVQTVSGTISSYRPMTCCIIDEEEELFLITNNMLRDIGINVDQQLIDKASQLALPRELVCNVTNDGDDVACVRLEQPVGDNI